MARSQAARRRCARRLRAPTHDSRRGGGCVRPPSVSPDLIRGPAFLGFTRRHEEGGARLKKGVSRRDRRGKGGAERPAPAADLTASFQGANPTFVMARSAATRPSIDERHVRRRGQTMDFHAALAMTKEGEGGVRHSHFCQPGPKPIPSSIVELR